MAWDEGFEVVAGPFHAEARLLPQPPCPWCGGFGRREVEIDGVLRVAKCRCQRLPDRVALYNAARIPARYAACTFESFRADLPGTAPGAKAVRLWIDRWRGVAEQRGLVLYGAPGRGKTHLLAAALRELVFRHGVAVRFIEFSHLVSAIKEGWDRNAREQVTITPLVEVPVLAIDELGKGRKTDFELAVIDEILTRRYNAQGVTLATTNFEPRMAARRPGEAPGNLAVAGMEVLAERIGERSFSRLKEVADFAPVLGEDFRLTRR